MFAYPKDLHVYASTHQAISYVILGDAPSRVVLFNYFLAVHGNQAVLNRFSITFYEDMPNIVRVDYIYTGDNGSSVTTGVQRKFYTYSHSLKLIYFFIFNDIF